LIHYIFVGILLLVMLGLVSYVMSTDKGRRGMVLAMRSLWLHKLRAVLSVLGIIIGNMAVISLMAFGEGSMQDALDDIARQGATNVIIRSAKPPDDSATARKTMVALYGLTNDDYKRFLTIPTITQHVAMRIFPQEIRYLSGMQNGRVVATTAAYSVINDVKMTSGRFLTDDDDLYEKNVAVIGSGVADTLFPFENPLDHVIVLGKYDYKVIGVIRNRMPVSAIGGSSQSAEDFNNDVYIPLQTCKGRFGEKISIRSSGSRSAEQVELSQVTLTIKDMDSVRPAGEVVRELLERYHTKNDYAVTVPLDRLEAAEREKDRFTMLLVMIAGISLFVGGIGIMNIMLATVTERTREIGIRRALGAKRRDIVLQFLIEAVVQTSVGGGVGVLLGLALVFILPWVLQVGWETHLPAKVSIPWIFYSLGFAVGVGVGFGLYPAWRASRLDPIEALRHE
jgi:putative ABC transport system permease protein